MKIEMESKEDKADPTDVLLSVRHTETYEKEIEIEHLSKVLSPEKIKSINRPLSQKLNKKLSKSNSDKKLRLPKRKKKGKKRMRRNSVNNRLISSIENINLMIHNYEMKGAVLSSVSSRSSIKILESSKQEIKEIEDIEKTPVNTTGFNRDLQNMGIVVDRLNEMEDKKGKINK